MQYVLTIITISACIAPEGWIVAFGEGNDINPSAIDLQSVRIYSKQPAINLNGYTTPGLLLLSVYQPFSLTGSIVDYIGSMHFLHADSLSSAPILTPQDTDNYISITSWYSYLQHAEKLYASLFGGEVGFSSAPNMGNSLIDGYFVIPYINNFGAGGSGGGTSENNIPPPPSDTTPPSTPSNLSATGITETQALLSWDASTDNVAVSGYRVYRDAILIADIAGTTLTLSGFTHSTTYALTIMAYDAASNTSSLSSPINITTLTPPPPPPGAPSVSLSASPSSVSYSGTSLLTWSSTNADSCTHSWDGATTTGGTFTTPELITDTTYTLSCTGTGGTASGSVMVSVGTPLVQVDVIASRNLIVGIGTTDITWSSLYADTCTTPWGSTSTGSTYTTPVLTASTSYTIVCTSSGHTDTGSLDIEILTPVRMDFLADNLLVNPPTYTGTGDNLSDDTAMPFRMGNPTYGTGLTAIPTFEAIGLYWAPDAGSDANLASVRYRIVGDLTWKNALPLWFDHRNHEYRGSIINVTPNTLYEIQTGLITGEVETIQVQTRNDNFPVAQTIYIPSGSTGTYTITQGGTSTGYVLYTTNNTGATTIDMGFFPQFTDNPFISVEASYVIVRGMTLKNCQRDGVIVRGGNHDVVIEENNISGFGKGYNPALYPGLGIQYPIEGGTGIIARQGSFENAAVTCMNYSEPTGNGNVAPAQYVTFPQKVYNLTIQRNTIHDPRYGSRYWEVGHPDTVMESLLFSVGEVW